MGVMDAAREAGVRVPGDVSMTGYDDQPEASWTTPGLRYPDVPTARHQASPANRDGP
ncbi:substrate-binding domain-containing protein [Micromonospora sp. NBC_01699]|uniref:substrate-binding domain-containing protein n=1 Tax=Micromonospora sp. NBC_01699 TaxID=2975984 RepID=UPI002E2CE2A6|nr:substrate-binding domain-containing protein [Micromonospora sp. NBC_01699]